MDSTCCRGKWLRLWSDALRLLKSKVRQTVYWKAWQQLDDRKNSVLSYDKRADI